MIDGRWKYFSLLLGLLTPGVAWAQSPIETALIRGVIKNSITEEPIENVNIYLANTTMGGWSAADGTFAIRGIPVGKHEVVISRIGYVSRVLPLEIVHAETLDLAFSLEEKVIQIAEHEVMQNRDEEWEENYLRFRRAFLGDSRYSDDCTILNPEILDLTFRDDTLIARANAPLRVVNQMLGYRLTIVIERFIWNVSHDVGVYKIYPLFEQLEPLALRDGLKWKENRIAVWNGSLGHFLMTLYQGRSESERFTMSIGPLPRLLSGRGHRVYSSEIPSDPIVGTTFRKFSLPQYVRIEYGSSETVDEPPLRRPSKKALLPTETPSPKNSSLLIIKTHPLIINPEGNLYDPLAVEVSGKWGSSRVAELLPRP